MLTLFFIMTVPFAVFSISRAPLRRDYGERNIALNDYSLATFEDEEIYNTKNSYNGTIGYNGLFEACQLERPGSVPCTSEILLSVKFWNFKINPSWILNLVINCVGYSSDDVNTIGLCVQTLYGKQVIPCSCNMKISVCCYI